MKNKIGQSLIELLLTIGLASILLPALITGLVASREGKAQQGQRTKATAILRETQEAVRSIRNRGWENIETNGTYHTIITSNQWELAAGSGAVSDFTQSIVITNINRNSTGSVVPTPTGSTDPSSKKIDITVSWSSPYASSITSSFYLTRWRDNLPYIETTQTQFNAGTHTGTTVRSSSPNPTPTPDDGEIILGSGGYGNWCEPNLISSSFNISGNGVSKGIAAIEGRAFLVTGENASSADFINLGITNPARPALPSLIEEGTYDTNLKANDIYGETVGSTSYAYIITDDNQEEIVILNASNNPPTKVGSANVSGQTDGNGVFVYNNTLFASFGTKLYTFDVTNRASPTFRDSIDLPAIGKNIYVVAGYAYVALNSSSAQLKIIDGTNPSDLKSMGQIDVNDKEGVDLYVSSGGNRVYLVTVNSPSLPEFFIINTENKNSLSVVSGGTFDTGAMDPKGVTITPGNRAVIVGYGGTEYQVLNIDNENSLSLCGSEESSDNLNGVTSVFEGDGDAYSYVITENADAEFRIIEGGPGGAYSTLGIFESQTFNPGYQTADNRFSANFSQPPGTTIQFQVALANLESGACPVNYTFVGQDGTSDTWYPLTPTPGIMTYSSAFPLGSYAPIYSNPGQCFRYKVKMTTSDTNQTPVMNDFTINYSP